MLMTTVVLICMRVGMVLGYDVIVSKISKSNSRLLIYGVDDRSVSLETRMRNSKQYQIAGFYNYGKAYKSYRLADLPVYYFNDEQDFVHIVTRYNIEGILFPDYEHTYRKGAAHTLLRNASCPDADSSSRRRGERRQSSCPVFGKSR